MVLFRLISQFFERFPQLIDEKSPLVLGIGIAGFFSILNLAVARSAKAAFNKWIQKAPNVDIEEIFSNAFGSLYGTNLLSLRTFSRSALISCLMFSYFYFLVYSKFPEIALLQPYAQTTPYIYYVDALTSIGSLIVADYLTVFIVKRTLLTLQRHPHAAVLSGFFTSIAVIIITGLFGAVIDQILTSQDIGNNLTWLGAAHLLVNVAASMLPAYFTFIWIPLLLISAGILRTIHPTVRAINFLQWALSGCENQPFLVIGILSGAVCVAIGYLSRALIGGP